VEQDNKGDSLKVLITGSAGFIGSRLWDRLEAEGHEVYGLDDLSRKTSKRRGDKNEIIGDVCEISNIDVLAQPFDFLIHLAGQVSVVSGEADPEKDFRTNALGTFRAIQWAKYWNAGVIFSSTNKVFGSLEGVSTPIPDNQPVKPETNYGVSKASGAFYVSDYEKGWVFHQSCIYGPTQLGEEDQGWVGWLSNSVRQGKPITCFGDGSQVRDLLHVEDLVALYSHVLAGRLIPGSYVVGGGPANAASFDEVLESLGGRVDSYQDWRPRDQKYFVSANEGVVASGWTPKISINDGLNQMKG